MRKIPDSASWLALCAVVARPDEKWGETPCAFVETVHEVDAAELLAFAKARLPKFAAPKTVIFGELPRTSTGKIQKFVLRERARERATHPCPPDRPGRVR